MNQEPNQVSTESQRLALEAMSAQLVHKLNAMIQEQEQRARKFAEQHHSPLATQQHHFSYIPETQATPPPRQETPASRMPQVPPPPLPTAPKPQVDTLRERLQPRPAVRKPAQKEQPEESNIGMGMVIFALVGIMILIRSCT